MTEMKLTCCLCGKTIREKEPHSTYRVEGDCKGFSCSFDLQKAFHNECLMKQDGINEIARAQVLDYIEAVQFNQSIIEDLKNQNLQRAQRLIKQIEWRSKYEGQKE